MCAGMWCGCTGNAGLRSSDGSWVCSRKRTSGAGSRVDHVTRRSRTVCLEYTRFPTTHARPLLRLPQRFLFSSPASLSLTPVPGGLVLWSRSFTPAAAQLASSPVSPVNSLIREALIEGRTADERYEKDGYAVKWSFVNDLELIFVVRICFVLQHRTSSQFRIPGCIPAHPPAHIR